MSREKTNITKPVYRYRTDSGAPTCVWDWDIDEVCEHYANDGPYCRQQKIAITCTSDGRVIPCDGCPLWLPEVEAMP